MFFNHSRRKDNLHFIPLDPQSAKEYSFAFVFCQNYAVKTNEFQLM